MELAGVVTSVKLRKGITDTTQDALIQDLALEMMQKALDYCGLTELPEALKSTIVGMTYDRLSEVQERAGNATGIVASVSDGQQSVSYKSASEAFKTNERDTSLLRGYEAILNRYRKVKFK